jgi:mycoredoxin
MPAYSKKIILYGNPFCAMVGPVRALLDRSNASYDYVDIAFNSQAAQQVKQINNGYASVPTLVFPDESTLTEPTIGEIKMRLDELGYVVSDLTLLDHIYMFVNNPIAYITGVVLLIFGFSGENYPMIFLGITIVALGILLNLMNKRR